MFVPTFLSVSLIIAFKQFKPTSQTRKAVTTVLGPAIFNVTSKNNPLWCWEERLALGFCQPRIRTNQNGKAIKRRWLEVKTTRLICVLNSTSHGSDWLLLFQNGKKNEVSD